MEATFTHEGAGGYACNSLMLYTTPIIEGVTLYIASSSVVMGMCVCVYVCALPITRWVYIFLHSSRMDLRI